MIEEVCIDINPENPVKDYTPLAVSVDWPPEPSGALSGVSSVLSSAGAQQFCAFSVPPSEPRSGSQYCSDLMLTLKKSYIYIYMLSF